MPKDNYYNQRKKEALYSCIHHIQKIKDELSNLEKARMITNKNFTKLQDLIPQVNDCLDDELKWSA